MRWVRLGGVRTLEVLGQSLDLRQVYQLQCVGGKCDGKPVWKSTKDDPTWKAESGVGN